MPCVLLVHMFIKEFRFLCSFIYIYVCVCVENVAFVAILCEVFLMCVCVFAPMVCFHTYPARRAFLCFMLVYRVASPPMESGHGIQNVHSFQGVTSSLRSSENNPHGHWTYSFREQIQETNIYIYTYLFIYLYIYLFINLFIYLLYIYILWDFMGKTWFSGRFSVRKWSFHIMSISPMTGSTTRGPRGPLQTAPSETASSSAVLQICRTREMITITMYHS